MIESSLTRSELYSDFFQKRASAGSLYLYRKTSAGTYALGSSGKKEGCLSGYIPLSFREIVCAVLEFEADYKPHPQKRQWVVLGLNKMLAAKKAKLERLHPLLRLVAHICDCAANFFSGRGCCSSVSLGQNLVDRLTDPHSEPQLSQVPLQTSPKVFLSRSHVAQQVFLRNFNLDETGPYSLMTRLKGFNSQAQVNLQEERSRDFILYLLRECNDKEKIDALVAWMSREPTFEKELLLSCLSVFLKRERYSEFAVHTLIKTYFDQGWYGPQEVPQGQQLLLYDPVVTHTITRLIESKPNDPITCRYAEKLMELPEFDLPAFQAWVRLFRDREKEKSVGFPMCYPLKNKLIEYLSKKRPEWKSSLKGTQEGAYLGIA